MWGKWLASQPQLNGFLVNLFDASFSHFITTRIIRVLYILGLVFMGLAAVVALVASLSNGFGSALFTLIVAPLL